MDTFVIGMFSRVVRYFTGFTCDNCRGNFDGNNCYYVCEDDHSAFCSSCASKINNKCCRCNSNISYLR